MNCDICSANIPGLEEYDFSCRLMSVDHKQCLQICAHCLLGVMDRLSKHRQKYLRLCKYDDYLRSDEWNVRRKQIIEAAGGACQICGTRYELYVHHNTYIRRGVEAATDLICVCRVCHAKIHDKEKNREANSNE